MSELEALNAAVEPLTEGQRRAVTSHLLGALSVAVARDEFDAALARAVEFARKCIP